MTDPTPGEGRPLTDEELERSRDILSRFPDFRENPVLARWMTTIDTLTTRLAAAEEQYERLATDTFDMIAAEAERAIRAESRADALATENQAMRAVVDAAREVRTVCNIAPDGPVDGRHWCIAHQEWTPCPMQVLGDAIISLPPVADERTE